MKRFYIEAEDATVSRLQEAVRGAGYIGAQVYRQDPIGRLNASLVDDVLRSYGYRKVGPHYNEWVLGVDPTRFVYYVDGSVRIVTVFGPTTTVLQLSTYTALTEFGLREILKSIHE